MGIRSMLSAARTRTIVRAAGRDARRSGAAAVRRAARTCVESLEGRQFFDGVPGLDLAAGPDFVAPTATVKTEDVKVAGGSVGTVTVRYTDDVQLGIGPFNPNGVSVFAPDGTQLQVVGVTPVADNSTDDSASAKVFGVYSFAIPGGTWDAADNGTYTVTVDAGTFADAAGNPTPATTGTFKVEVPTPDVNGPQATIKTPPTIVAAGGAGADVTVVYNDASAIATSSIGVDDIVVTGPDDKALTITAATPTVSSDGTSVTVVYTVAAPGGTWDLADNGNYKIAIAATGPVADAAGNLAIGDGVLLKVKIPEPLPPAPPPAPVATLSPVSAVTAAGGQTQTVTVTYAEDGGLVDASTIGVADVVVTGPSGAALTVTGVTVTPPTSDAKLTATYTLAAPGGAWDSADNGTYTVAVAAGAVADTAGTTSAVVNSTFNVTVPVPAPVIDTQYSGGTPVNTGFVAEATATTTDGKLIVVGRQGDLTSGSSQYVIKRINANGSVDTTFGNAGVVVSTVGGNAAAFAVAVGPDGAIYLAGSKGGAIGVWKFKATGAADNKFGAKGEATIDASATDDRAYGLALGGDGSVVVVGGNGTQFVIAKLLANGSADAGFGTAGAVVGAAASDSVLSGAVVNADGTIVAGGSIGSSLLVYKFLPTGQPDASFAGNGRYVVPGLVVRTDLNGPDYTVGVGVQPDGKILVTGQSLGNFAVARITQTGGDLDLSFANGGIAKVDLGGDDDADQVIVQGTGQILVIGTTQVEGQDPRLGIAALTADGALDPTFGNGGIATVDSGLGNGGKALHIGDLVVRAFGSAQGNGQVIVGTGQASANNSNPTPLVNSGLRRLNVPGSGLLGSFGTVNGANRKLTFLDADGTKVTFVLKGGTGKALYDGSKVDIVLTGTTDGSTLTVTTKGGDGKVLVRNLSTDGGLKAFAGKTSIVSGAFTVNGRLAKADLSGLEGTLAAAGGIGTLTVRGDLKNAVVLSGANLGSDNAVGGTGSAADTYVAGGVGVVKVGGAIRSSVIGVGLSTTNATLLDDDDTVVDPTNSVLGTLTAKGGLDAASRVVAGKVGKAKVPGTIDTATDSRFEVSPA